MDCKVYFLLVAILQLELSHSHKAVVSGVISDNLTFIHKTFAVPPSIRTIIEVDVSYPIKSVREQNNDPVFRIYTTTDSVDVRKNCLGFRQTPMFGNGNLDTTIRTTDPKCRNFSCEGEMFHYTTNVTIPYFKPSKFSFSFGFYCSNINP